MVIKNFVSVICIYKSNFCKSKYMCVNLPFSGLTKSQHISCIMVNNLLLFIVFDQMYSLNVTSVFTLVKESFSWSVSMTWCETKDLVNKFVLFSLVHKLLSWFLEDSSLQTAVMWLCQLEFYELYNL